MARHEVVRELLGLLNTSSKLKTALRDAIEVADRPTIKKVKHFCDYVDDLVHMPPNASSLLVGLDLAFYYIIGQSDVLKSDSRFQQWMVNVAKAWGEYLDGPESVKFLASFVDDPSYGVGDYHPGPGGWQSFNQFFARQPKPGRRPIADMADDDVIAFPCDGLLVDQAPIDADANVTVKGVTLSISKLIAERTPKYAERFAGGQFCHLLLRETDYHRFHTPVAGKAVVVKGVPGNVSLQVVEVDGELEVEMVPGFQVTQGRGLILLETPRGLVGMLPVGMGHISSVVLTAERGADLFKGQEVGYFQFGGSDVVLLFERPVKFGPPLGKQGSRLAEFTK